MKRILLLLLFASTAIAGTVRHVVPSGGVSSGNALTQGTGWTIDWAANAGNAAVPGDTMLLHGGTYSRTAWLQLLKAGTPGNQIVYRNYPGERAIIQMTADVGEWTIAISAANVTLWGLEINRTVYDTYNSAAIIVAAADAQIINCVIRNSGSSAIVTDRDGKRTIVHGTIFLFSGNALYGGTPKHGYGIYSQNAATDGWKEFSNNVFQWGWYYDIHLYTSDNPTSYYVQNYNIRGNAFLNPGWIWRATQYESSTYIGVEPANPYGDVDSITYVNNYVWYNPGLGSGSALYTYYGDIERNLKIDSNIVMGGSYDFNMYPTNTYRSFTKNVGYGPSTYPSNLRSTYTNNTWLTSRPTSGDTSIVRFNAYEPKRAHIIVYNWSQADSVTVNPAGFAGGDTLRIRNTQNLYGDAVFTKIYDGAPFKVPMRADRWSIETPVQSAPPESMPQSAFTETFPRFGVFLVTATAGSYQPPTATKLNFGTEPSSTLAGAVISPAVTVRIEAADGSLISNDARNVTVAIGTNPGGGTLSGTLTIAASGGIATFSNLSINNGGTGYTLTASASGLTGDTSTSFNITSPPARRGYLRVKRK